MDDVYCAVVGGAMEQIGCRLLQLKLDQGDPVFVDKICSEAQPYLADMMKVCSIRICA